MKMKEGEHARGDCIEDAGFFAFADRSRRHLVECGKKRLGEIAKFAGFDFFSAPGFPLKIGSSAAGRKAFSFYRAVDFLHRSRLVAAMKRMIGPIFSGGRWRAAPTNTAALTRFLDACAEEFFVCTLARR